MSIGKVIDRLARTYRDLNPRPEDVAAWCNDVVEESGIFEAFDHVYNLAIVCKNGMAPVPCNLYRLISVSNCNACGRMIPWVRQGDNLCFNNLLPDQVWIEALVFKQDEKGYPLIDPVLVNACYWYCVMKLWEPTLETHRNAYENAEQAYYQYLREAKGDFRNVTQNDVNDIMRMMRSFHFPKK